MEYRVLLRESSGLKPAESEKSVAAQKGRKTEEEERDKVQVRSGIDNGGQI